MPPTPTDAERAAAALSALPPPNLTPAAGALPPAEVAICAIYDALRTAGTPARYAGLFNGMLIIHLADGSYLTPSDSSASATWTAHADRDHLSAWLAFQAFQPFQPVIH